MVKIRIGGVPEHYNYPIQLAKEKGMFEAKGIDLEWNDFGGGTGQMTKALRDGEIDVCILLTEGIITDIIRGNPAKIISDYVTTPLTWGIHSSSDNPIRYYNEIFTKQYAISRFGSGSHLMAIVDAESKGHKLSQDQFAVINDIEGARESLKKGETDVFYWEKYTTKPYVDSGEFKRIGEYNTPWPCFVIAATDEILRNHPDSIIRMLRIIHDICDSFMQDDSHLPDVARKFNQKLDDIERWYNSVEWAIHGWVSDKMIDNVIYHLKTAKIIEQDQHIPELIWKRD